MPGTKIRCSSCKAVSEKGAIFCRKCGRKLPPPENKSGEIKGGLKHRWIIFTILLIFAAEMVFSFIAGFTAFAFNPEIIHDPAAIIKVSSRGSLAGIFAASLVAGWKFRLTRPVEPVIGASIVIIMSKFVDMFIVGTFSFQLVIGSAIGGAVSLLAAFAGIALGHLIYENSLNDQNGVIK